MIEDLFKPPHWPGSIKGSMNGNIQSPEDYWWEDVADGEECDTFCYCPANGDAVCRSGYADIMDDTELKTV